MGKSKPPTSKGYFENRALNPEIMATLAIRDAQERAEKYVGERDELWFVLQAETWLRWFHANNPTWRRKLERENNADRDFIAAFTNHWADAFVKDPSQYKERHPIERLAQKPRKTV